MLDAFIVDVISAILIAPLLSASKRIGLTTSKNCSRIFLYTLVSLYVVDSVLPSEVCTAIDSTKGQHTSGELGQMMHANAARFHSGKCFVD